MRTSHRRTTRTRFVNPSCQQMEQKGLKSTSHYWTQCRKGTTRSYQRQNNCVRNLECSEKCPRKRYLNEQSFSLQTHCTSSNETEIKSTRSYRRIGLDWIKGQMVPQGTCWLGTESFCNISAGLSSTLIDLYMMVLPVAEMNSRILIGLNLVMSVGEMLSEMLFLNCFGSSFIGYQHVYWFAWRYFVVHHQHI